MNIMQILSTNVSIFFLSFLPPFHLYNFFFFLSFRFRSFLIFIYFLKRLVENSLHKALDVNLLERLKKCVSIFYLNGMRNCVVLNVPSIFILNECNWVKLLVFFSLLFLFSLLLRAYICMPYSSLTQKCTIFSFLLA